MSKFAYTLLGLTAIVAALVGVLAFAVARFIAAARELRTQSRGGERAFMASALEDAVGRLRTQERAMTARAEASERLSDQIMASLGSGLIVVAVDGGVRLVNPAAARLLALPEIAGAPYRSLLASAPPLADLIERCLATGETLGRHSVQLDDETKGTRHFGVGVSALRDGQGTLRGAICLFTDLTSVVALEEQVRLKESLARLGELTAGLAHEFRNGLATIHGYGRLLDPDKVPAEYRPYVLGIREETEALGHVVTNFLAFAKPAAVVRDPVDLRAVVEGAAEDMAGEAAARGGALVIEGRFGRVSGDSMLLRQAVSNLLRNALESCQQASVAPLIRVDGEVDAAAGTARISVSDNGAGVPPAVRARLFTPFFTTKPTGTGLGLALVQKIVVSHDGRVGVAAPATDGACFQVELPLAGAQPSPQT